VFLRDADESYMSHLNDGSLYMILTFYKQFGLFAYDLFHIWRLLLHKCFWDMQVRVICLVWTMVLFI